MFPGSVINFSLLNIASSSSYNHSYQLSLRIINVALEFLQISLRNLNKFEVSCNQTFTLLYFHATSNDWRLSLKRFSFSLGRLPIYTPAVWFSSLELVHSFGQPKRDNAISFSDFISKWGRMWDSIAPPLERQLIRVLTFLHSCWKRTPLTSW